MKQVQIRTEINTGQIFVYQRTQDLENIYDYCTC